MSNILKKAVVAGLTYGGLEYVKYRFKGGRPLLERAREALLYLRSFFDEDENKKPIKLEANDFRIV